MWTQRSRRVRPPVRVLGFLPLTDNMPGGDATRVGDVLRIRNGTTVEVLNTDAEGRLVLADALSLAGEAGLTMAQLAVAWVLQNPNVASAIVGATRPEQVHDNVKAAGVKLEEGLLKLIDEAIGGLVERDPAKTESPRDIRA